MKLNHINLTVDNVAEAHDFLQKYFGLRSMGRGSDKMAGLFDDDGFALVLMKGAHADTPSYPRTFHIGFIQQHDEAVDEIYRRLQADGFEVPSPSKLHGSWAFYFLAPGGFTIEVAH